jgi:hypothetical protein
MSIEISIFEVAGEFAHNKDKASELRKRVIIPGLQNDSAILIDFQNVDLSTQSFIHALISEPIHIFGIDVLERIAFKNCNETIRTLIEIVVDYLQDEECCVPQELDIS